MSEVLHKVRRALTYKAYEPCHVGMRPGLEYDAQQPSTPAKTTGMPRPCPHMYY